MAWYSYDRFGNVRQFYDNGWGGGWQVISYDQLNRLTSAYGRSYNYDNMGRLTNYEGASMTLNPRLHLALPGTVTNNLDANGNLIIKLGFYNLTWDAENHLSQLTRTGLTENYTYDADGIRVKKVSNGVASYYYNSLYEINNGTATKYYYFGGMRIAMRVNGAITYLHTDHLDGTVLATNSSGGWAGDEGYYAFGRDRHSGNVPTDHRFTGQKTDASGLMYYNARYYDPDLGQFVSPDTIVPDPTDIMSFNRYMYVGGRPLNYNDPSGHYSDSEIMQNFNCPDWACVEGVFGQGGSMAGLWGWLYILQQANNGNAVSASSYFRSPGVNNSLWLSGRFYRQDDTGEIMILGDRTGGSTAAMSWSQSARLRQLVLLEKYGYALLSLYFAIR